ncbi:hypothetical protein BB560_005108 [Smittium megazygosporum]|uniref:Major facilitator superfamily (MFS) profile domain-containing protein n=1 Tax=Smittium megazygosporum TaxID=133381 RepID=A0A2T9Z7K1_9FUNG|nr:hypothetical protein BB560_005108 [Smittium megazygosporum]
MTSIDNEKTDNEYEKSTATLTEGFPMITTGKLVMVAASLSLLIFSATLSGTIISTATNSISKSFGTDNISWVAQSFLIISTALQPAWGKLSDIFGCRPPVLIGIVILLSFSVLAGLSVNMLMLIISRAFMGVGASACVAMVNIIISEMVPIQIRGEYMGVISAANGVGQVIGPLIGGIISENISWRWTMFVNIPVILIASVPVYFLVKLPSPSGSFKSKILDVDFKGIFILVLSITLILVGVDFGSKQSWGIPKSYLLISFGMIFLVLFLLVEYRTKRDPIISLCLFTYRNVSLNLIGALVTGYVMYVGIFFIPELFIALYNISSTSAGVNTWPWMVCVIFASVSSGIAISKLNIYIPFLWVGSGLLVVGFGLMCTVNTETAYAKIAGFISIIGLGIGLRMPSSTISAQVAVTKEELAQTTALLNFFRNMGGILGLSISKAVLISVFNDKTEPYHEQYPEYKEILKTISGGSSKEIFKISELSLQNELVAIYVKTLKIIFMICSVIAVVGLVASLFIKNISIENEASKKDLEEHLYD